MQSLEGEQVREERERLLDDPHILGMAIEIRAAKNRPDMEKRGFIVRASHEYARRAGQPSPLIGAPAEAIREKVRILDAGEWQEILERGGRV